MCDFPRLEHPGVCLVPIWEREIMRTGGNQEVGEKGRKEGMSRPHLTLPFPVTARIPSLP